MEISEGCRRAPRGNRDGQECDRKKSLLLRPHVAPLTAYVETLREHRGGDESIPYFDPTDAGIGARVLVLLEAPGPKASNDSGFVSADNDDATAANMWHLYRDAGYDRSHDVVAWNILPVVRRNATEDQPGQSRRHGGARPAVQKLLGLLHQVRVVVLLGRKAQRGWRYLGIALPVVESLHPSPRGLASRPDRRGQIREALEQARRLAGIGSAPVPVVTAERRLNVVKRQD